jgi:toxin CcdB
LPQFDVHLTPGRPRPLTPFVVDLQSNRLARAASRLVVPLVLARPRPELYLAPRVTVLGRLVFLDVFNLATIPADRLGPAVAAIVRDEDRTAIIRAIDELLSQA